MDAEGITPYTAETVTGLVILHELCFNALPLLAGFCVHIGTPNLRHRQVDLSGQPLEFAALPEVFISRE